VYVEATELWSEQLTIDYIAHRLFCTTWEAARGVQTNAYWPLV
jgi:hypothetical protein